MTRVCANSQRSGRSRALDATTSRRDASTARGTGARARWRTTRRGARTRASATATRRRGGDPWRNVDLRAARSEGTTPTLWRARVELAACHQLCDKLGLNEGVCNHLTCAAPGRAGRVPVRAVRAGVERGHGEQSGDDRRARRRCSRGRERWTRRRFFIHLAIHRAGAACVLHTHMPRASALCCVESFELAMCHQNSLRFAGDVAYDPTFNGLVLDNAEGERLVKVMDGKRVLMHKHHGVIVSGASVAEAFDDLYYLERAAEVQILAMSTGSPLSIIGDDVARRFRRDMESDGGKARWARLHYDARMRELARDPLRRIFTD